MGACDFPIGEKIEVPLIGHFVYSMGGYTRISERPVGPRKGDGGRDESGAGTVFEIPDYMIAREPKALPRYPDQTLYLDTMTQEIWRFEASERVFYLVGKEGPANIADESSAERDSWVRLIREDDPEHF